MHPGRWLGGTETIARVVTPGEYDVQAFVDERDTARVGEGATARFVPDDPLLASRAARLVDRLVIGVAANIGKGPLFELADRVALVEAEAGGIAARTGCTIEVVPFAGLLVAFAREHGAQMIVRGLRAVTDFDYEFQMAGMNRQLMPQVETVFLTPSDRYQFISGTFVREIATLGGDVAKFVSPSVLARLTQRTREANGAE